MSARILLVDDHQVVRQGIKTLISENADWEICGEAENGKEAIEKTLEVKPDLIVMDLSMPVMNGIEATKIIREAAPFTRILILTMHEAGQMAKEAKSAGAHGFVTKASAFQDLRNAISELLKKPV
jgi:DNA-binding NarL/FixJ family response regulator